MIEKDLPETADNAISGNQASNNPLLKKIKKITPVITFFINISSFSKSDIVDPRQRIDPVGQRGLADRTRSRTGTIISIQRLTFPVVILKGWPEIKINLYNSTYKHK